MFSLNNRAINQRSIFNGNPTSENLATKLSVYNETSVVFGLFIGYLITQSTRNPVETYYSLPIAYICIQGRGFAAMIGTLTMLVSGFITNTVDQLLAIDIEPDTDEQAQKQRSAIFNYLKHLELIQMLTYMISLLCFVVFVFSYCAGLISIYHKQLDFSFFVLFMSVSVMITLFTIIYIKIQMKNTMDEVKKLTRKIKINQHSLI